MNPESIRFVPSVSREKLSVDMVIRFSTEKRTSYWRITHAFDKSVYVMEVSTPEQARNARRPQRRRLTEFLDLIESGEATTGRIRLPAEFVSVASNSSASDENSQQMDVIRPLVEAFGTESNLSRWNFTRLITGRAVELGMSTVTLRRLLLRYYYFGRVEASLRPLVPGPKVAATRTIDDEKLNQGNLVERTQKRRGRQPVEAQTLGSNEFVVRDIDVADMVDCLESRAKSGVTTITAAHIEYLRTKFAKRNPQIYAAFIAKQCPVPVTRRQFDYYTKIYCDLTSSVAENVPAFRSRLSTTRGLLAAGPGEMYEIDATGGRIFLVDSQCPSRVLGKPIIYLMVDRWSRYVVSIYVTLRPASWEEIRYLLLIAFTSRERRFKNLGIDINDTRWPPGKVCSMLVADRGSEMISEAMLTAASKGLKIEPVFLPPFTPDGKGIVERLIGVLKQRMAQRGIKGVYAERPMNPLTKRAAKRAFQAATYSLQELYRILIEIIDEYNNRSHSTLEKRSILKRNRVAPTPRAAYVWGLNHLTGIVSPPLADDDYRRLLLGVDTATIANGHVMYRGRKYLPANALAWKRARESTSKRKSIEIRVDRSDPVEIFEPAKTDEWPVWHVTAAGLQDLRNTTLEEDDVLNESDKLLIATTRNESLIAGLLRDPMRSRRQSEAATPNSQISERDIAKRRKLESQNLKRRIIGPPLTREAIPSSQITIAKSSEAIEEAERLATIAAMQRRRR